MQLLYLLLISSTLLASTTSKSALLSSIDPKSAAKYLAFYELYPETPEGKRALERAYSLLSGSGRATAVELPSVSFINQVVALINKDSSTELPLLSEQDLVAIDNLAKKLGNRKLKGFRAHSHEKVLALEPEEIDLARGLLLADMGVNAEQKIRSYEALLDLMALQVKAQLPRLATDEEKVIALSKLIFEDLQFQFPPHSEFAKDIDLYTFLPSVLDSRRGVCLGVSILYLCIAQRIDLPLEIVTPPGHIYVRLNDDLNIETTHRGIHVETENYLGIGTTKLPLRDHKETIGFAFVNQASVYWGKGEFQKARSIYEKARLYLPNDPQLKELYAYSLILTGEEKKARILLKEVLTQEPLYSDRHDVLITDILNQKLDADSLGVLFKHVDEKRSSLLEKKKLLESAVAKYPEFRSGWQQLGMLNLQLHKEKKALSILQKHHKLSPDDPMANYVLAILYAKRLQYKKAWEHYDIAEALSQAEKPKALKALKKQLHLLYPRSS